jgi:hypothetical protein
MINPRLYTILETLEPPKLSIQETQEITDLISDYKRRNVLPSKGDMK